MKKYISVVLLVSLLAMKTKAQTIKSVGFAAFSESVAFPFTRYAPIHPGLQMHATLKEKESDRWQKQFNTRLGFFYHRKVETAFFLGGEYVPTLKIFELIGIQAPMGLGYLHTFFPGDIYKQNTDTGEFETKQQLGRPHFYAHLGLGISLLKNQKIQPFIQQELMIETPFANGIPFVPHALLKLGVQIKLKTINHE